MGENLLRRSILENVGCFSIKPEGFIIIHIDPRDGIIVSKKLGFLDPLGGLKMTDTLSILDGLEKRGITVEEKIRKLISSGFFCKSLNEALRSFSKRVIIVKGRAVAGPPETIIKSGLPGGLHLVNKKVAFHLAYLLSLFIDIDFLNIHGMNTLYIMSEPLEKTDEHDDNLIVDWSPDHNSIGTRHYRNPYSGDTDTGYVFFN